MLRRAFLVASSELLVALNACLHFFIVLFRYFVFSVQATHFVCVEHDTMCDHLELLSAKRLLTVLVITPLVVLLREKLRTRKMSIYVLFVITVL